MCFGDLKATYSVLKYRRGRKALEEARAPFRWQANGRTAKALVCHRPPRPPREAPTDQASAKDPKPAGLAGEGQPEWERSRTRPEPAPPEHAWLGD